MRWLLRRASTKSRSTPRAPGDTLAGGTVRRPAGGYALARLAAFCNCAGTLVIKKAPSGMALPELEGGRDGGLRRVPCGMHAAGKPGMTAGESESAAYWQYRARGGGGRARYAGALNGGPA